MVRMNFFVGVTDNECWRDPCVDHLDPRGWKASHG